MLSKSIEEVLAGARRGVLECGDMRELLRRFPEGTFDAVVTDPPYGLSREPDIAEVLSKWLSGAPYEHDSTGFQGKEWDTFVPGPEYWREAYRVMKPGAHIAAMSSSRTWDLLSIAMRLAGFEVRNTIACYGVPMLSFMYSKAMPKNVNIGAAVAEKAPSAAAKWAGYGTALKPSFEVVLLMRKPLVEGTIVDQVLATGTGALDIDGCRVPHASDKDFEGHKKTVDAIKAKGGSMARSWKNSSDLSGANDVSMAGRFPPNTVLCHMPDCTPDTCAPSCAVRDIDRQGGGTKDETKGSRFYHRFEWEPGEWESVVCLTPKASQREKQEGLPKGESNDHATVKPLKLMQWLVRLVTPARGLVLDPFCGSGTTALAAIREGMRFVVCDNDAESRTIARGRIKALAEKHPWVPEAT